LRVWDRRISTASGSERGSVKRLLL